MGMQQSVARSEPVVLRTGWLTDLVTVAGTSTGILVVGIVTGDWASVGQFALMFAAFSFLLYRRRRAVVTDEGIQFRNLRMVFVPWSHIERIDLTGGWWRTRTIRVYDVVANVSYRLESPGAYLGMGYPAVDRAFALVNERWLAHRDGPRPPLEQWAWRPGPPPTGG